MDAGYGSACSEYFAGWIRSITLRYSLLRAFRTSPIQPVRNFVVNFSIYTVEESWVLNIISAFSPSRITDRPFIHSRWPSGLYTAVPQYSPFLESEQSLEPGYFSRTGFIIDFFSFPPCRMVFTDFLNPFSKFC
ncbi:hypothetical protein AVEN_197983-1 [Araneus ventricosus]|uniref:Uncharacterized protein n=1 Tax=Araneus ventricosus TaxID=182803 RepID=A0A4Y2U0T8_ARAVE|nr:hypothetical protein AVEN_197983-1 [Araneus ventricosus]